MKILILGAGGVGGYFGARLLKAGADVTYLLREKRQAKILAEGLIIETPTETFTVQPKTITQSGSRIIEISNSPDSAISAAF